MFEYLEKSPVRFHLFQFCSDYFGNNFLIAEGRVRINLAKLLMYMFRDEKREHVLERGGGCKSEKEDIFSQLVGWQGGPAGASANERQAGSRERCS